MKLADVALPSNRKFGFFFTFVFVVAGTYFLVKDDPTIAYGGFGLAVLFFLVTLVKADVLLPLNKLWMQFGLLLGMIVSPIVLGVIFFGLFTPVAIAMRLSGRDELRLKVRDKVSHWIIREPAPARPDAFKHQF